MLEIYFALECLMSLLLFYDYWLLQIIVWLLLFNLLYGDEWITGRATILKFFVILHHLLFYKNIYKNISENEQEGVIEHNNFHSRNAKRQFPTDDYILNGFFAH